MTIKATDKTEMENSNNDAHQRTGNDIILQTKYTDLKRAYLSMEEK